MHSTAEVTALTIAPAAVLEAVALNAEAAVTSFARGAVQRAQMTAPDPAEVVVVAALASCGANRDERRNPNGDNASFCTELRIMETWSKGCTHAILRLRTASVAGTLRFR